jgi:DNA modification methylase
MKKTELINLTGDALTILKTLPCNSIASTITSPPYLGKLDYEAEGQIGHELTVAGYFEALAEIFAEVYRVTAPGGCLILNLGQTWSNYSAVRSRLSETKQKLFSASNRRGLYPGFEEKEAVDPSLVIDYLREVGWLHRDTWIWDKIKPGRKTKSDRPPVQHEFLYYFRKPTGGQRYKHLYWNSEYMPSSIIQVRAAGSKKHPCPFPPLLVKPLILATTGPGMTVLDPFGGLGTVAATAVALGRNGISIDLKEWQTWPVAIQLQIA